MAERTSSELVSPRIVLTQRAPVEGYPPVLHQARILASLGAVTVVDYGSVPLGSDVETAASVRRMRVTSSGAAGPLNRVGKVFGAMRYRRTVEQQLASPTDVAIAYEPEAAAVLLTQRRRRTDLLRVVHLHEHPSGDAYEESILGSAAVRRMLRRLPEADLVVVADAHRSALLSDLARLLRPPVVVMNCPMRLEKLPESKLLPVVQKHGVSGPIVHYQGAIGPDHCLEAIIEAMQWLPENVSFVLVGGGADEYVASLKQLAGRAGVEHRVKFLGRVPYNKVFSFAVGATVGMSMLDTDKPNWRFAAGASNKRFEYMALGIPQVTNAGPGICDLFEQPGVALTANPSDSRDIARQISRYLDSAELRHRASVAARELHLSSLNYQTQFAPVLSRIEAHLSNLRGRRPQVGLDHSPMRRPENILDV